MSSPRAPDGLGTAGKRLWRRLTKVGIEYGPQELLILEEAARTADKLDELRRRDTADNPKVTTEIRLQSDHLRKLLNAVDWPALQHEGDGEWDGITASQRARKAAHIRWKKES